MSDFVQGGIFSVMVVRIDDPNDPNFEGQLAEHVSRSLAFFAGAPVILDLKNCAGLATVDSFQKLRSMFKRQHLLPVGVQNANATQVRAALNADLANFPPSNNKPRAAAEPTVSKASTAPAPTLATAAPSMAAGRTKIVTQPVRSGTQIYAKGGDLVVLATVSAGAEVIADGNVHIYGTLRGRAIAGAAGDSAARLFIGKLEAELVCIAGHYLVSEAIPAQYRGQNVHVVLEEDRLSLTVA